jgi:dienelactone hydrolase
VLVPLVFVALGAAKLLWRARFYAGYDESLPLDATTVRSSVLSEGRVAEVVSLQTLRGETTTADFRYPSDSDTPVPCVVVLLWLEAERAYIDMFAQGYLDEGYALFAPEGLGFEDTSDPPSGFGPVRELYGLQRIRRSVVEARRSVDYLVTRPEIDGKRIYYYGISLGAMVGPALLAQEKRFQAGVLAWGAGDARKMMDFEIQNRNMGLLERLLFRSALPIFEPADPILWVDRVAPRPLLFQNARMDDVVPVEAITALHDRAQEPKTIIWYDSLHNEEITSDLVFQTLDDQIDWLKALER